MYRSCGTSLPPRRHDTTDPTVHPWRVTAEPFRQMVRIPPWVWDLGAAVLVLAAAIARFPGVPEEKSAIGWVAVLAPAGLMFVRRQFPLTVLIGSVVCFGLAIITVPPTPGSAFAVAVATYTLTVQRDRKPAVWIAVATAVVMVAVTLARGGELLGPAVFQIVVTLGFATALGDATRTRRAYIAEITDRAVRAEATREAEASRRVAEDRLQIARDLHDTVAHQISVISLNAGVASSAIDARPEAAREALATIRVASRAVLAEIGDLLSTLRLPGDQIPRGATVGLGALDDLIAAFIGSGPRTTVRIEGDLATVPPAIDVVAYRVIQEALTNAHKHGAEARAHLFVSAGPSELRIVVTNPAPENSPEVGSGHGLVGIRERVRSVQGTAHAGREGGTFRVDVSLPLENEGENG